MYWMQFFQLLSIILVSFVVAGEEDIWKDIKCDEAFFPDNCDFSRIPLLTVEDYDRCGPGYLPLYARNYYFGWAGQGMTYRDNRKAFGRIKIRPKLLRDVSDNSIEITTLGQTVSFPVGIAPSAFHKLANPEGEIATARAAAAMETIMILSSFATTTIEDVARAVEGTTVHLWMQLYVFKNRDYTIDIIRRAEKNGFEALVLTVDADIFPRGFCDAKNHPEIKNIKFANAPASFDSYTPDVTTFKDITWLKKISTLPIIVKGILRGDDAKMAIKAGASAIFVSNHGGRQVEGDPATIDALPEVVAAVNKIDPRIDVYMDGGIRNGFDVYKALARGARMVFLGRPALYGLTIDGEEGVKNVLSIIKREFNETMVLSGSSCPDEISSDTVVPARPIYGIDCSG